MTFPLTAYIEAAMELALYDKLEDGSFAGEIPRLPGVIAFGNCEQELRFTLEDWILVGLRLGHKLPKLAGYRSKPTPPCPVGIPSKGVSLFANCARWDSRVRFAARATSFWFIVSTAKQSHLTLTTMSATDDVSATGGKEHWPRDCR